VEQEEMNVAPIEPEVAPPEIAQIDPMPTPIRTQTITRSGRVSRPPAALNDFPIVVYKATQHISDVKPDSQWMSRIAFAASTNPDVLYMHKAMQQEEKPQFIMAMKEEVEGQTLNGNCILVERD
jgi:hypothetical protein